LYYPVTYAAGRHLRGLDIPEVTRLQPRPDIRKTEARI